MAWNGTGTFVLTDGTYTEDWCVSQAGDGDPKIKSTEMDALFLDLQNAITACLAKNGENAMTGDLPMGGNSVTGLGTPSASTDAGLHGDIIASGAYDGVGDQIVLTQNDGTTITVDTSGISAGTGGVDLTTAQTVGGIKTFSAIGSHAHAKFNGPTTSKVVVPTPGASVTIDTTAANDFWVTVGQNTNVTFTWPSAATDSQLGANWSKKGEITFRHSGAGYTITLNSTMLSALTDYSVEGTYASGSGDMSTLTYNYKYINGSKYCQFAWVSTP